MIISSVICGVVRTFWIGFNALRRFWGRVGYVAGSCHGFLMSWLSLLTSSAVGWGRLFYFCIGFVLGCWCWWVMVFLDEILDVRDVYLVL